MERRREWKKEIKYKLRRAKQGPLPRWQKRNSIYGLVPKKKRKRRHSVFLFSLLLVFILLLTHNFSIPPVSSNLFQYDLHLRRRNRVIQPRRGFHSLLVCVFCSHSPSRQAKNQTWNLAIFVSSSSFSDEFSPKLHFRQKVNLSRWRRSGLKD